MKQLMYFTKPYTRKEIIKNLLKHILTLEKDIL